MTALNALLILQIVLGIAIKAVKVLSTGKPISIDEELTRLEAARLRPSADIVKEADEATKEVHPEDSREGWPTKEAL